MAVYWISKINAPRKENMQGLRWNPDAQPAASFLGGVEFPNLLRLVFFNSALMREKFAEQANPSSTLAASHLFTRFCYIIQNSKAWRTHELSNRGGGLTVLRSHQTATQQQFFFFF